jgi:hypothetical protein
MRRSLGVRVLAIVTLAGCSSLTYSSTRLDALQAELNRRYGLWKDLHIPSYDYRLERTCLCDSSLTRPVIVSVLDSSLAGVVYADSGTTVPDSLLGSYFTVEGLFFQVQAAINLGVDSLGVAYDPVYHYPTRIVVDQDFRQLGDELSLFSSNLTPKQP